jgi:ABC-type transport system substrate-binding protein
VDEAHGNDIGSHPVGTGLYLLKQYKRSSRIVLAANPQHRDETYVPSGTVPPELAATAAALKGRKLPLAGWIEISVIEEPQSRWLAFLNRETDFIENIPGEFIE